MKTTPPRPRDTDRHAAMKRRSGATRTPVRLEPTSRGGGMTSASPVFVVGAPRSGTTLLYHMLLSAGGFAYYRAETHVYSLVGPRFGWLRSRRHREAFWAMARDGFLFQRAGLSSDEARSIALEAKDAGSFLESFMTAICRQQGVDRWAECTPDHALFLRKIGEDFPDARVIHILRDGRDVALSLARQGWIRRLPFDPLPPEVAAAFYWDWLVGQARRGGKALAGRFLEIRYEDLVRAPERTLTAVGDFIGANIDYDTVRENAIGSVSKPNTSYPGDRDGSPLERWRRADPELRGHLWSALAATLEEMGCAPDRAAPTSSAAHARWKQVYRALFTTKHWIRNGTPLGRRLVQARLLEEQNP